jgi:D-xylonolactonase
LNHGQPHSLWPIGAELGEGPLWQQSEQALYFVDIRGQRIYRCAADGSLRRWWPAPQPIGFLQPLADGTFVAGLRDGLYRFNPHDGSFELFGKVTPDLPGNRLNDAFTDPFGRLWFGSMDNQEELPTGNLYQVCGDAEPIVRDAGYVISNGPAMSPDGGVFYHTDTLACVIYAFDVAADGSLSNKRPLLRIADGFPDGTTVDAAGHLWIAIFGGGRIERYSPQGQRVDVIHFPCANVTKLAFGGPDLQTAFVTTAWKGLSAQQRRDQPLAGNLFAFRSATPGLPQQTISIGFSQ